MLFSLVNLPYWIFLAVGVLLYLMVILTGGGDDGADTDVEVDANVGHDLDFDADANGDFNLAHLLGWLGFGKAPLILLLATDLSVLGVAGWILNVLAGEVLGDVPDGFWAGVLFGVAATIALLLGSLIARPLGKVFAQFGEDTRSDRLIGCVGTVSSAIVPSCLDGRIGQVDVLDAARNLVTVPTVLPEWATVIPQRGEKVLVIDRQPQFYVVITKDSPDQDHWFSTPTQTQH
ncbi:MAG: YqiJ family protein [Leptolyngbyaceae cyanobacterium RU_5_1]|nr:YqiJ family protein [Leptolyngbyaceae cyanobacterium RU_5_1]